MKIVQVLYSGMGGHGAVAFSLLGARAAREDTHALVFFGVEPLARGYAERCRRLAVPYHFVQKRSGLDPRAGAALAAAIARERPDVVLVHQPSVTLLAWAVARLSRCSLVVRENFANQLKTPTDWRSSRITMRFADAVVFLSTEYRDTVSRKLGAEFRPRAAHVIPNGIDLAAFEGAARSRDSGPVRIGMVSRFVPTKDHATILASMRALADEGIPIHATFAGDGPMLASVRETVSRYGLEEAVSLPGAVREEDIPALLRDLDVYVQSTEGETMSTSIMQAMAAGLPIVASDVRGVSNMLADGAFGLLVPYRSVPAMTTALRTLASDTTKARALGEAAREHARQTYSNEAAYARYRQLFGALRDGSPR